MKRHPWLVPFSHEHHDVLFQALELRRATPAPAARVRDGFLGFWSQHGPPHFDREEAMVLPALGGRHPAVERVLAEHEGIRAAVERLAESGAADPDALHRIGETLAAHVRFEERELFPLVERELAGTG